MPRESISSSINLVDLDFNSLKNSFKNYLKTQAAFRDYDFEGSNLNVLLDLLAYNTFKNAFYTNMAISEGFVDSAQLRNSLMSHAKELNYLPRSARSAVATVKVDFEASGVSQPYVIPKGSQFSTLIRSKSFVFSLPKSLIVSSPNTSFTFTSEIYEGVHLQDAYIFQDGIANQRFKLTNKTVDTRSINVVVYEDGDEIGETFFLSSTLLGLNFNSKVFFLQPSETGNYEIYFGDGILGYQPKVNATIVIDYRISQGEAGDGAKTFSVDFDPTATNELTDSPILTVIEASHNGAEEESNESIRYFSPRHFQVQERTVTEFDYQTSLKTQFPEINTLTVFGGEEANPPRMGRVFIAVDISNVDGLPESKRQEYKRFLRQRAPFGILPLFIEPQFMYLQIVTTIRFDLDVTTNSVDRIETIVTNTIVDYNTVVLNDFNVIMRQSQFRADLDNSDPSIISNITNIRVYKKLPNVVLNVSTNYTLEFGLRIKELGGCPYPHVDEQHHSVESSTFRFNGAISTIADDGMGHLFITTRDSVGNHVLVQQVGSVDYTTGMITLTHFEPEAYDGSSLKFYVLPHDDDIKAAQSNILTIEPEEIFVTAENIED